MPKFVMFDFHGSKIAINPDRVTGVGQGEDGINIFDGSAEPFTVRGTFEEVVRKLEGRDATVSDDRDAVAKASK